MGRASRPKGPVEVFISYAHEDEDLRKELEKHLSILKRQKMITGWQDRKIIPGHNWKKEIDERLNTAKVILLLISADFMASDYCYGIEMKRALQRDKAKEARVIPVILRDVYWRGRKAPFSKLQSLPTDARAVTKWEDRDSAFANIAEGIAKAVEEIQKANSQLQVPPLRGISDRINNREKNEATVFQDIATYNGNTFAFEEQAKLEQQQASREIEHGHWQIVLSGTIKDINKPRIEAIVEHLRQISGDPDLQVSWVKPGSIILGFDDSRDNDEKSGFELIEYLFRSGKLTSIDDIKIQDVSWQPSLAANIIWNVPHRRNPNFTGREDLLRELREKLLAGQSTALTQVIYGLGGVGKTQLATEYAYRYAGDYDVVWWMRAEEAATLAADYAGLAGRLGLPEASAREQEVVVEAVRGWLEGERRWLLVFDNANGPEDVGKYLPRVVNGHVIITSRNPNWGEIASPLQVTILDPERGAEFLLSRTRQKDEASARKLSEELGGLPLALAQAGAYIEANGVSIADYLELFQQRREELWADERGPFGYERTVNSTLGLAVKRVEVHAPASVDLLRLCAFLGPDDIPRSLLIEGKEYLPEQLRTTVADELKMNRAVEALRYYSLVEVNGERGSLSVHRLMQAVVRDGLGEDESKVWAGAAVDVVDKAFPSESYDVRTWAECARLLPHALAATAHVEELGIASGSAGRLLNMVGLYLWGRAQYMEAKTVLQRSVPIVSKVHGEEQPEYATVLNNLGTVLQALGDLQGAKEHFEGALAIDEQAFGPDHPTVAIRVNNLGTVLRELGDLQGAKEHYERALAIGEQVFGPDHPTVAIRVNNLGMVLQALGDLQGAKAHLEKALAIDEQAFGPDHPTVARAANNLGTVLRELGDLQGAKEHFERALAIGEQVFGLNHPQVAIYTNNLGMVLKELGNLQGARAHYERALAIDEQVFGSLHPNVARAANNLGSVLQDLGDLQGARAHLERALRIFRRFLPAEHPNIAVVEGNLEVVIYLLARKGPGGE